MKNYLYDQFEQPSLMFSFIQWLFSSFRVSLHIVFSCAKCMWICVDNYMLMYVNLCKNEASWEEVDFFHCDSTTLLVFYYLISNYIYLKIIKKRSKLWCPLPLMNVWWESIVMYGVVVRKAKTNSDRLHQRKVSDTYNSHYPHHKCW